MGSAQKGSQEQYCGLLGQKRQGQGQPEQGRGSRRRMVAVALGSSDGQGHCGHQEPLGHEVATDTGHHGQMKHRPSRDKGGAPTRTPGQGVDRTGRHKGRQEVDQAHRQPTGDATPHSPPPGAHHRRVQGGVIPHVRDEDPVHCPADLGLRKILQKQLRGTHVPLLIPIADPEIPIKPGEVADQKCGKQQRSA